MSVLTFFLRIVAATWSVWRIPTAVFSITPCNQNSTDISEEEVAPIIRMEDYASKELAWSTQQEPICSSYCMLHTTFSFKLFSVLKMEAIYLIGTLVEFQHTTECYIPADRCIHNNRWGNPKSYICVVSLRMYLIYDHHVYIKECPVFWTSSVA
jgi:hypothetical protein